MAAKSRPRGMWIPNTFEGDDGDNREQVPDPRGRVCLDCVRCPSFPGLDAGSGRLRAAGTCHGGARVVSAVDRLAGHRRPLVVRRLAGSWSALVAAAVL